MLNYFESVESLSIEEYQVVIEYMSTPMSYTAITDIHFWDKHLYALKLTKPDEHGQRYFELANSRKTKIPLTQKQEKDHFNHDAILLDMKVYFHLHTIDCFYSNLQLIVHFPSHTHLILKKLKKHCLNFKKFHELAPEVYTHPGFIQNHHAYQVMRLMGMDLPDFLKSNPQAEIKEELAQALMKEVEKVHQRGIIHTDIKPENFCIEWVDGKIKAHLIDYDDCLLVRDPVPSFGFWGTLPYYAPEFYEYLPSFIRTPQHLRDFGKSLQLSLYKNIPFFLISRFQKSFSEFMSVDSFAQPNHGGFLSLCEISDEGGCKFNLNLLESYLLNEEWRAHISQKSDIYALGLMLALDLKLTESSIYLPLVKHMLAWNPDERFEFESSSSRISSL
jgi:serine/threonine protein kinase